MNIRWIFGIAIVFILQMHATGVSFLPGSWTPPQANQPPTIIDKQLETLRQRESVLEKSLANKTAIERAEEKLTAIRQREQTEFLRRLNTELGRQYQTLDDIQRVSAELLRLLRDHQNVLVQLQKNRLLEGMAEPTRTTPTFDDLHLWSRRLSETHERIDELRKNQQNILLDQEKRKSVLSAVSKELDERKQQQKTLPAEGALGTAAEGWSREQYEQLLALQIETLQYQKILAQLKIDENSERIALIDSRLTFEQRKQVLLQEIYGQIKRLFAVDGEQVKKEELEVAQQQNVLASQRELFNVQIQELLPTINRLRVTLVPLKKRLPALLEKGALSRLKIDPAQLTKKEHWDALAQAVKTYSQLALFKTKIELIKAQIKEGELKLRQLERRVDLLRSWHWITRRALHLRVGEDLAREIKKYDTELSQLRVGIAELSGERDGALKALYNLNAVRENIKTLLSALQKERETLFIDAESEYQAVSRNLLLTDDQVNRRIEVITKLLEIYSKGLASSQENLKQVEELKSELEAKSFWKRSEASITLNDLKNFFPDIKRFLRDIRRAGIAAMSLYSAKSAWNRFYLTASRPLSLLKLIFVLLFIMVMFVAIRRVLPRLRARLLQGELKYGFLSKVRFFLAYVLEWINHYFWVLYPLGVFLLFIRVGYIYPYFAVLFYLAAIPLIMYGSHLLINYLAELNAERMYFFMSQQLQTRFLRLMPILDLVILLLFFKHAFVLGNTFGSRVPDVLQASIVILLQLILIIGLVSREALIGKSRVCGFVPRSSPLGKWIEVVVTRYHYALLFCVIAIMILINPYVGLIRQVSYALSRLFITILLVPVLSRVYEQIKRVSSEFFFYYPDGVTVKERFSGGKSWYGLIATVLFICFIFFGGIFIARLWGYHLHLGDIKGWFEHPFFRSGVDEAGNPINITAFSLVQVVLYVVVGTMLVYLINQFVLKRVLDPVIVGSGVQNTVTTLTRYAVVVLAFLIGLRSVGLGDVALNIFFVIAGVGYILREPIADFLSYFIILVQRPIKVGDMIKIDDPEVDGEVRHITPRVTLIRQKNSVTVVVPNSLIVTKIVRNWTHSRSFSACDDITLVMPYSANPETIRMLLLQAVDDVHGILKNPTPIVRMTEFHDNGYQFMVRCFISTDRVPDRWDIESQLRFAISKRLCAAGHCIASPSRIVTFHSACGKEGEKLASEIQKITEITE